MLNGRVTAVVSRIGTWLCDLYALDLDFDAAQFVISAEAARALHPNVGPHSAGPRTGVLVVEEECELSLGLFVDERDAGDLSTLVEETSHLVCLAWHARRDLQVSQLLLELQGDIDRFLFRRLWLNCEHVPDVADAALPAAPVWADWLRAPSGHHLLGRYQSAHRRARRYCRDLQQRFPARADVPELLCEVRAFYRAAPEVRLRHAAA